MDQSEQIRQAQALLNDPAMRHQRRLAVFPCGMLVAGMSGIACIASAMEAKKTETSGHLFWKHTTTSDVPAGQRLALAFAGLALLALALFFGRLTARLVRLNARRSTYEAIFRGVESLKVDQIASVVGCPVPRVYKDLRDLIHFGMLDNLYVDFQQEQVLNRSYVPKESHKTVVECSGCGAKNELIVGVTRLCNSCATPLMRPSA